MSKEVILTVRNHHVESCGVPTACETADPNFYTGYFENQYGEQWIYRYDKTTKKAELRGGDCEWDNVYPVVDGRAAGLIMNAGEQAWLQACWYASTRYEPKPAEEQGKSRNEDLCNRPGGSA